MAKSSVVQVFEHRGAVLPVPVSREQDCSASLIQNFISFALTPQLEEPLSEKRSGEH